MRYWIKIALCLTFVTASGVTVAGAAADDRYQQLGKCMAYTAIKSGLNGQNTMSPFAEKTLGQLGDEFMFEASKLNIPEQDAQNFVVYNLVAFNLQREEKGIESLDDDHSANCDAVIKTFR